jgi:hypothetical protein
VAEMGVTRDEDRTARASAARHWLVLRADRAVR